MHGGDTTIGGIGGSFEETRWTRIIKAKKSDTEVRRKAVAELLDSCWKPIYLTIRHGWHRNNEEAKDLTQDFIAKLLEQDFLAGLDPGRGSFRGFIKATLRNFMRDEYRSARQLKRGGGNVPIDMDVSDVADYVPSEAEAPEAMLDREWARQVLQEAVQKLRTDLRTEGKERQLAIFEEYQTWQAAGRSLSQEEIAQAEGISLDRVEYAMTDCRARLRNFVETRLRQYCENAEQLASEMDAISALGKLPLD
ncbi:MAG: hypothetical protein A3F84_18515 [Candidatus Handelsmanbacteria bacterium RIFCSPLOWO2_12_FULL_64_10]|uniref:RNA polymerase sigma-70 region 2 domain-containing protein n=1 Tax=Handelsmanbacteria sp. (strain RIFCSPLOWO2_12_FULL_64_10) TaxID=1817868 RepID=A0A1F6D794_HANXR|nr:MAG: hypothetical protein A3F84_18515 [Candidatus Handelsmanbacteria bacterium RIFCSPLOWO2_12_FULL_64_10]